MPAAVFAREGVLELQERPIPDIAVPTDVVIEVEGCGICGTDLHILDTPPAHPATPGCIMGHEYLGRIVAVGPDVQTRQVGDRVAVAPNLTCGLCPACQAGRPNHCTRFTTLGIFRDGGLAPFNVAPERACFPLPDAVPFEDAVWTEVLSCVVNSVDNVRAQAGETAVIIGGGPVGALHAALFLAGGVRVVVADLSAPRLRMLAAYGVHRVIDVSRDPLGEVVAQECAGGADVVVDCVGTQLDLALTLARPGGRVSLFGMNARAAPPVRQNTITRNELTIYGSYVGVNTFPRAIALLASGTVKPSAFLSRVSPLAQIATAMADLRCGDAMKVVIRHG